MNDCGKSGIYSVQLHHRHAVSALVGGSVMEAGDLRMVFQQACDCTTQLAGSVPVHDPHRFLLGHERLVQQPLRA